MRRGQAYTLGLVDACGLHHCVLEAARDLRCARARYAFAPVDWALLVRQLNADIHAANRFLPDDLQARTCLSFGACCRLGSQTRLTRLITSEPDRTPASSLSTATRAFLFRV